MVIIGVTGTLGAGKGTVVNYMVKKYGFAHYSARDFIVREVEKRGLGVNRDTMTEVANDLRKKHSPGYIIEELFREAAREGKNSIIESIRTLGEIEVLRKSAEKFYLFAVDADPRVRYERIRGRKSATDEISFQKFTEDENREMVSDDPNSQNLSACIARADFVFNNNRTPKELERQIGAVMKQVM